MDPQASWQLLLDAWSDGDWEEVVELASALLDWLDKQGFAPETSAPHQLGHDWNEVVVRAACSFAVKRAGGVIGNSHGIPDAVPFTLTCGICGNDGPDTHAEALAEGWQQIRYAPTMLSANFVGICPSCSQSE